MSRIGLRGVLDDGARGGNRVEGIRLGLEEGAAALPDLRLAIGQPGEEGIDVRAHLGGGAEAGVRGDFIAPPAPERFGRVEVGAVRGQADQPQPQVGRGQVGAERLAGVGGGVAQETTSGPGWRARKCFKKEIEVSAVLLPPRGIASTSPVSTQTAE